MVHRRRHGAVLAAIVLSCVIAPAAAAPAPNPAHAAASSPAPAKDAEDFVPIGRSHYASDQPESLDAQASRNARYVTYLRYGWPGEDPYPLQVYRRDRRTGEVLLVSHYPDGSFSTWTYDPDISWDGRYIVYTAYGQIDPADQDNEYDIYLWDATTDTNRMISIASDGSEARKPCIWPRISRDGAYVTFSCANPLVPEDTDSYPDVYRFRVETGELDLVSQAADGGPGELGSWPGNLSGDGRHVTFSSASVDLVAGVVDDNGVGDLFVRDMATGTTSYVSRTIDGTLGDGTSTGGSISRSGNFIAFESDATNLAAGGGDRTDVFRFDRRTGEIELVSGTHDGSPPDSWSMRARISGNGRFVVFESEADNLLPGTANYLDQIFLRDTSYGTTYLVSHDWDGGLLSGGQFGASGPVIGASSRWVLFHSDGDNVVRDDEHGTLDVFYYRITKVGLRTSLTTARSGEGVSRDFQ